MRVSKSGARNRLGGSKGSPGQCKACLLNRVMQVKQEGRRAPNGGNNVSEGSVAEMGLARLRN